jgi:hypothetical protein
MTLRTGLLLTYRIALVISTLSLLYLLFMFGHTETTPLRRILATCCVAAFSALVAGLLQWVGLPADPNAHAGKKHGKARTAGTGK